MTLDSALKNRRFPLFCCCGVCGVMNCHLQPVSELARSWSFRAPQVMPASGTDRTGIRFEPVTSEQYEVGLRYQSPGWSG